jgi:organic hydroperoxide reductase OsmC/OhrA
VSEHKAVVRWRRDDGDFLRGKYARAHSWSFDGGVTVPASSAPSSVPLPWSDESAVDPEEAFVASLSSCHMLTFLYLASRQGFVVESYEDAAVGVMSKADNGIPWVSAVTLNPDIVYGGDKQPDPQQEQKLHHEAHRQCFIANSVKTAVQVAGH